MRARKKTIRLLVVSAIAALGLSVLAPASAMADEILGTIPVGPNPFGVAFSPDSTIAYVANSGGTGPGDGRGTVSVVDVNAGTNGVTTATWNLLGLGATSLRGIDVSNDGTRVYVVDETGALFVLNSATGAVLNQIALTAVPGTAYNDITVSPNGLQAWAVDFSGGVSVIDLTAGAEAEVEYLPLDYSSTEAVFSIDGSKVYVPAQYSDVVVVIDATTRIIDPIIDIDGDPDLLAQPTAMTMTPDGLTAYVTGFNSGLVYAINLATNVVTTAFPLTSGAFGIAINTEGSKLVVANQLDATVSIINLATNTVAPPLSAGGALADVIMSPSGDRAYITNRAGTTLVVVGVDTVPGFRSTTLPNPQSGVPYSATLETTGFPDPTFSVTAGALPDGLTLDPTTGEISGTPSGAGVYNFSITAANSNGSTEQPFSFTVAGIPPVIATTSLPDGTVSVAYSSTIAATGDEAPTFAVTAGALPAGLSLNSFTGEVSGVPTAIGSSTFTVTATNSEGTDDQVLTIVIAGVAPVISTTSLPDGTLGAPYSQVVESTGDEAPSFAVTAGALPAGLSLNPVTGEISGTPTASGAFTFTVTATNSEGTDDQALSIDVIEIAPTLTTAALPSGTVGTPYVAPLAIPGGSPATFAVTSGTLPAGLTLDPATGVISGTPTSVGVASFGVTATNGGGTDVQTFSLTIVVDPAAPAAALAATGSESTPVLVLGAAGLLLGLALVARAAVRRRRTA